MTAVIVFSNETHRWVFRYVAVTRSNTSMVNRISYITAATNNQYRNSYLMQKQEAANGSEMHFGLY